jgi:maltose O-acetyltransferase
MSARSAAGSYLHDMIFNVALSSRLLPRPFRGPLLRACGVDARRVRIGAAVYFGGRNVHLGAGTFLNDRVHLDATDSIWIGENCQLGMDVLILTGSHLIGDSTRRAAAVTGRPVVIGDGCWLGARVTIMPGVTVGDGCVVGAGAVVTSDCEPNGVYLGVPARRAREIGATAMRR